MSTSDPRARLLAAVEARVGALPAIYRDAYLSVDRARFVRDVDAAHAWDDVPLPLDTPHGRPIPSVDQLIAEHGSYRAALFTDAFDGVASTISGPSIYAASFHLLGLKPGDRLLELGTGTGYGAALAAQIVGPSGSVTSVDVDPALVHTARGHLAASPNVRVLHADGLARPDLVQEHDRIYVAFAVEAIPTPLLDALQEGAILIAPVGRIVAPGQLRATAHSIRLDAAPDQDPLRAAIAAGQLGQTVMRYRRTCGRLESEATIPAMYIPGRGFIQD